MTLTVLTTLTSDCDLLPEYVYRLKEDVAANLSIPHRFACLTDQDLDFGVVCSRLRYKWPRHYAKINMFDPWFSGRILYLDLSVRIVGSLDEIASQDGVVITKDFYYGTPSQSVLLYDGGQFADTHEFFRMNKEDMIAAGDRCRAPNFYDQVVMNFGPTPPMRYWQDVLPGQVVSHRVHCREGAPKDARIVKFHGKPKPWELPEWKASRN